MERDNVGAVRRPLVPCVCPFLARKHLPLALLAVRRVVPQDLRLIREARHILVARFRVGEPDAQVASLLVLRWWRRLVCVLHLDNPRKFCETNHLEYMVLVQFVAVCLLHSAGRRLRHTPTPTYTSNTHTPTHSLVWALSSQGHRVTGFGFWRRPTFLSANSMNAKPLLSFLASSMGITMPVNRQYSSSSFSCFDTSLTLANGLDTDLTDVMRTHTMQKHMQHVQNQDT